MIYYESSFVGWSLATQETRPHLETLPEWKLEGEEVCDYDVVIAGLQGLSTFAIASPGWRKMEPEAG
jgi:hypothetical protein